MQASLPEGLEPYAESPLFTETTLPEKLRSLHALKAGTWGKLMILAGSVDYVEDAAGSLRTTLSEGDSLAIPPQVGHHLELRGSLSCKIVFHRQAKASRDAGVQ